MLLILLAACVVGTLAAPQAGHDAVETVAASPSGATHGPPIEIVSASNIVNADGSFNYSYEASDGTKVEQSGYLKPNAQARSGGEQNADTTDDAGINVIQGSYSYTAPDGTVISVRYIADENGFQPIGDHIPTPPPSYARAVAAVKSDATDANTDAHSQAAPQDQGAPERK